MVEHILGKQLSALAEGYRKELVENILPFWVEKSPDRENGGYFTCLDRTGEVFDTDKFIWLQGREVWCFSFMFAHLEARPEWLEMALLGADFLERHGRDTEGNWYFSLTADGRPLVQPYNIFSDCFACMAFAALYKIKPEERYRTIALDTFENILRRQHHWKGTYSKAFPGTRPLRNFSLPMILCNLALEMEGILGKERVDSFIPIVIHEVMEVFLQADSGLILENVQPDGSFSDSFEGRLLNPGHTLEAMWFIMDLARRIGDEALIGKARDVMLRTLDFGWDKEYGGILYFLDIQGHPTQQLEWDQKLWWVHVEALVAMAKAWTMTGDERCAEWFQTLHDYTWNHFRDPDHGEWFGYLNRRGEVLLPLKGGKWKGCFHIPRSLYQVWKTLEAPSKP
ncbi:MAG: AGE family epimerase/isomerase [Bacteroidetes bacterium]|nr:AGE family epimerase/isomerase [Bacteroidota bacterium]